MITPNQRNKIISSIRTKINPSQLVLLPHFIQKKYILQAKTDQCKERLVLTAVLAAYEDQRQGNNHYLKAPIRNEKSFMSKIFAIFGWGK